MKIAIMVRGYMPVPRPKDVIYAPIDLAIAMSEGLVRRGHTVDFYGPLGTKVPEGVTAVTHNLRPLVHDNTETTKLFHDLGLLTHYVPSLWDEYLAVEMFKRADRGEYDLLCFEHPEVSLSLSRQYPNVPVVNVLNDPIFPWYKEIFELYHSPNQHYVTISDNQRRDAPDLPYVRTVYNGVDLQHFPFCDNPEDYLLIAGRIVPEKGFKEAIQIARQTGDRLLIIGPVYPESQDYFDQYIKPQLSDRILYLGYVESDQMWRYFQKAKAFLTPVQWEEPFGLTTIEAMACGTPTISLRRGAAPEIIVDGKTGFVVDSIAEMAAAVGKISQIRRVDCRDHVKKSFSIERMVDGYERAFDAVLRTHTRTVSQRGRALVKQLKQKVTSLPLKPATSRKPHSHPVNLNFEQLIKDIAEGDINDANPA
ncbi:MAG TPA: glycosyltransferase family 4 protein [Candidatus Saccharimonadales bacterium]|nr:glycosyltransferase family 4 protein [Candidatus Saccharimonadales bacterium]